MEETITSEAVAGRMIDLLIRKGARELIERMIDASLVPFSQKYLMECLEKLFCVPSKTNENKSNSKMKEDEEKVSIKKKELKKGIAPSSDR